jgi:hypothetical protein
MGKVKSIPALIAIFVALAIGVAVRRLLVER